MVLKFFKKEIETSCLFPIGNAEDRLLSDKNAEKRTRGVAMIIAVFLIAVMMIFAADLIVSSQVNLELAIASRDNLKAEYMAKSAQNLSLFLISIDHAIDLYMATTQKSGITDSLEDVWSILNGLPIGGDTIEMITSMQEKFELNKVLDDRVIQQLKLFDGEFIVNITDESSKINVNYCAMGRCTETLLMLQALFSCPVEKLFLENKKINAKELAYKIKDYIDNDSKAEPESGVNDEVEPYQSKVPPYPVKNAPFDSPDELKMVDGWDDEMETVFGPYITIFPFQAKGTDKAKININTASRALLTCLVPEAKVECNEKFALAMNDRNNDKTSLIKNGEDVNKTLQDLLCYKQEEGTDASSDKTKWFDNKTNVFRIEVNGRAGKQEKKITTVVERIMPDAKEGTTSSNRILYWKIN